MLANASEALPRTHPNPEMMSFALRWALLSETEIVWQDSSSSFECIFSLVEQFITVSMMKCRDFQFASPRKQVSTRSVYFHQEPRMFIKSGHTLYLIQIMLVHSYTTLFCDLMTHMNS